MSKVWLWHEECRSGQVHCKSKEAGLKADGWCDSPAQLSPQAPKAEATGPTVEAASIEQAVEIVKAAGYSVLTPIEAQAAKASEPEPEGEPEPEEEPEAEEAPTDLPERADANLLALYRQSPALLDDEEVFFLAKELDLKVQSNMKRETVEAKINEALTY